MRGSELEQSLPKYAHALAAKKLKESLSKSMANLSGELLVTLYTKSLRKSFQNQVKVGLERTWSICLWNP